jgi:hypothetical protein
MDARIADAFHIQDRPALSQASKSDRVESSLIQMRSLSGSFGDI